VNVTRVIVGTIVVVGIRTEVIEVMAVDTKAVDEIVTRTIMMCH